MDPRITEAVAQMRAAPRAVALAALAARVRLSPSRFTHLFRQETGVSPVQYLRALRMLRARVLIERTFLSIKEVMFLVGCHDPSHFTRDFRRFHGMPPRECRAAAERRPLGSEAFAADETAAVLRLAAAANTRQESPRKPRTGARGRDSRLQPPAAGRTDASLEGERRSRRRRRRVGPEAE